MAGMEAGQVGLTDTSVVGDAGVAVGAAGRPDTGAGAASSTLCMSALTGVTTCDLRGRSACAVMAISLAAAAFLAASWGCACTGAAAATLASSWAGSSGALASSGAAAACYETKPGQVTLAESRQAAAGLCLSAALT